MKQAISIKGLKKHYKEVDALKGITLDIPKGSFYGLLGPNGAGKTTIIHCITGLANPTEGTIKIFGNDAVKDYRAARRQVGLCQQDIYMDPYFSVFEVLCYQAGYFGVPKKEAEERAHELLKQFGIHEKRKSNFRKLSGGMKKKVEIAKALMHKPKILILDEPSAGIDVQTRIELWEYIKKLNKEGLTILLTTHYIEEAQELCETVAIINEGKIIEKNATKELLNEFSKKIIIATYKKKPRAFKGATSKGNTITVHLHPGEEETKVINQLMKAGTINNIETKSQSLEEVFLDLTNGGKK